MFSNRIGKSGKTEGKVVAKIGFGFKQYPATTVVVAATAIREVIGDLK